MRDKSYSLSQARKDLPLRRKADNKTQGGKCLIIAGADGQWGAAVLCATAAARSGAGYTFIFDFKNHFPTLKYPDFLMTSKIKNFSLFQAVAVGPGLKDKILLKKFLLELHATESANVVLDAEALNLIAELKKPIALPATWILTPHEGEMARLLKTSSEHVKAQRSKSVLELQKKMGCIVLLKGSPTLIADGKNLYTIKSGNPALAKAGTGDVLTGIIAGLLSQKMNPVRAACLASYVHGFIADQWVQQGNDHLSLLASDLIKRLPKALAQLRHK